MWYLCPITCDHSVAFYVFPGNKIPHMRPSSQPYIAKEHIHKQYEYHKNEMFRINYNDPAAYSSSTSIGL